MPTSRRTCGLEVVDDDVDVDVDDIDIDVDVVDVSINNHNDHLLRSIYDVNQCGATHSADLGGSSKYSYETYED